METMILAYSFGIITVVLTGAVVMIVGLNKKVKGLTELNNNTEYISDDIHSKMNRLEDDFTRRLQDSFDGIENLLEGNERRFEEDIREISRGLKETEYEIMSRIREVEDHLRTADDGIVRMVNEVTDNLHRKIDSRVDKLEARLTNVVIDSKIKMIND